MARINNILGSLSLVGLLVALQIFSIHADNSVHILSNHRQRVTSSTLNWLPSTQYDVSANEIVIGGFEIQHELDGSFVLFILNLQNSIFIQFTRSREKNCKQKNSKNCGL